MLSGRSPCGQVRRRVRRGVPGHLQGARDRAVGAGAWFRTHRSTIRNERNPLRDSARW